jgi:hypothetical protein
MSTGLRNMWLSGGALEQLLAGGAIEVYGGVRPASPDVGVTSTLLGRITQNGEDFVPGSMLSAGGLQLILLQSNSRVVRNGVWTFKGAATGTATWFRWRGRMPDGGGTSTTAIRMDGDINASPPYDLILANTAITNASEFNIQNVTIQFDIGE